MRGPEEKWQTQWWLLAEEGEEGMQRDDPLGRMHLEVVPSPLVLYANGWPCEKSSSESSLQVVMKRLRETW